MLNHITREVEVGELRVPSQPGLHSEFPDSQCYTEMSGWGSGGLNNNKVMTNVAINLRF